MNCTEARESMLTAEVNELRGRADGPLAAHLAECSSCRLLADALIADLARASRLLRARARRRVVVVAAIPVAAVALIAVVTLVRRPLETPARSADAAPPAKVVTVDVARGQQAAVIRTADPKTTLIWISSGDH